MPSAQMLGSCSLVIPGHLRNVDRHILRAAATVDGHRGKRARVQAGLSDDWQKFWDSVAFEKWAPRSSRTWRLGQVPGAPGSASGSEQGPVECNCEFLIQRSVLRCGT